MKKFFGAYAPKMVPPNPDFKSPPMPMMLLVTSLILTRGSTTTTASCSDSRMSSIVSRLQSVQNAAARVVFSLRQTANVTNALICRQWPQVLERTRFKVAVLVYRSLRGNIAAVPSDLHPDVGDPTCSRFHVFNWSLFIAVCPAWAWATALFRFRAPCSVWSEPLTDNTSTLLASAFSALA
jgi:hypothetical protein